MSEEITQSEKLHAVNLCKRCKGSGEDPGKKEKPEKKELKFVDVVMLTEEMGFPETRKYYIAKSSTKDKKYDVYIEKDASKGLIKTIKGEAKDGFPEDGEYNLYALSGKKPGVKVKKNDEEKPQYKKLVSFGKVGYEQYQDKFREYKHEDHNDNERLESFRKRFNTLYQKNKYNPKSAIYWSWNYLW